MAFSKGCFQRRSSKLLTAGATNSPDHRPQSTVILVLHVDPSAVPYYWVSVVTCQYEIVRARPMPSLPNNLLPTRQDPIFQYAAMAISEDSMIVSIFFSIISIYPLCPILYTPYPPPPSPPKVSKEDWLRPPPPSCPAGKDGPFQSQTLCEIGGLGLKGVCT